MRIQEPFIEDLDLLVARMVKAMRPWFRAPFALFGHSMGALVAFACAQHLKQLGVPEPAYLFVSGSCPPHLPPVTRRLTELPDDAFLEAIRGFGGLPEQILRMPELLELTLPILRADLRTTARYQARRYPRVGCPIAVLAGLDDPLTSTADLESWGQYTDSQVEVKEFPGGHFFVRDFGTDVLGYIVQRIGQVESFL